MNDKEELEYELYLIRNVLRDCIDKLNLPQNREMFLLYYGISAKQSHEIDKLFLEIVEQNKKVGFSEFHQMLNQRLDTSFASEVVEELLRAYKDYEPIAVPLIEPR